MSTRRLFVSSFLGLSANTEFNFLCDNVEAVGFVAVFIFASRDLEPTADVDSCVLLDVFFYEFGLRAAREERDKVNVVFGGLVLRRTPHAD